MKKDNKLSDEIDVKKLKKEDIPLYFMLLQEEKKLEFFEALSKIFIIGGIILFIIFIIVIFIH